MKLLETREITLQESDLRIQARVAYEKGLPEPQKRSDGIHLSGVLKYIAITTGMLKAGDEDFEDEFPLRMALGMAMECWFQALWPEMSWQPGEIAVDGVTGSMDGYSNIQHPNMPPPAEEICVVEEFKLTYKSSRERHGAITGEWLWMHQLMSYCYMLGTQYGRLHVVWLNGAYEKVRLGEPRYCVYLVKFDERELVQNWKMIQASKGKAKGELHT